MIASTLLLSLFAPVQGLTLEPATPGSAFSHSQVRLVEDGQGGNVVLFSDADGDGIPETRLLQPGEERAWIGVEISTAVSDRRGLEVVRVVEDSPASRAGLKVGDRLLALDGEPLADFAGLRKRLDGRRPGQGVQLTLRRDLEVRLDERGHGEEGPRLGVRLSAQAPSDGLVVTSVELGWPAASAGLRGGDRIVTVDGRPAGEFSDLQEALARVDPGESIRLGIDRRVELELRSFPASLSAPAPQGGGFFLLEPPDVRQPDTAPRRWLQVPEDPEGPAGLPPVVRRRSADPDQLQQQMRELADELRSLREELSALRRELELLRRDR